MRKTDILFLTAALLLFSGCRDMLPVNMGHLPLYSHRHESSTPAGEQPPQQDTVERSPLPFAYADSVICVSVLHSGSSGKTIQIYKNWKMLYEIPVSDASYVDEEEDHHHLIGEHLYTEYHTSLQNIVCCDGKRIASLGEHENLKGIYRQGEDIFLLSDPGPGRGFVLRKNGEIILSRSYGTILGDLSDTSYAPGGALYEDSGYCRFSWLEDATHGTVFGNGPAIAIEDNDYILDIKMRNGISYKIVKHFHDNVWSGARIWFKDDRPVIVGETSNDYDTEIYTACCNKINDNKGTEYEYIKIEGAMLFYNRSQGMKAVTYDREGHITIWTPGDKSLIEGTFEEPRQCCCKICDDGMIIGLNPKDKEQHPKLSFSNRLYDMTMVEGKIQALTIGFCPPS